MHFYLLLSSLISVATIVSTATIPQSIQIHYHHEEHKSQIHLCTTMPPTPTGMQSTGQQHHSTVTSPGNDRRRNVVSRGQDDHEKLVALCEAGFVTGCQRAIQEGAAEAPKSHPKTILKSTLALLGCCPSDGTRNSVFLGLSFITVVVAVVRIVIFFRQSRSECPVLKQDGKTA